ncbi:Chaperone protein DnaJ [Tetrabaena socialis]|uniref:Chaperone protein DnaJ n=1 Tax=Tetrabaena socialis TaxID=47790 RepID=A0A2J7ZIM6_9CHLO|nr:Chaperone protein DnaJ [Tetrabaena socialis]|eukprot:PNH00122.1 Chaperone protein DnaJ [Tetrabaena socialis]
MEAVDPPLLDLYAVLGVDESATIDEVKAAFRRQLLAVHPDKLPPFASDAERATATERTRVVLQANEVLSNTACREQYDRARLNPVPDREVSMAEAWEVWIRVVLEGVSRQYGVAGGGPRFMHVLCTILAPALGGAIAGVTGIKVGMALATVLNEKGIRATLRELAVGEQLLFMRAMEVLSADLRG